MRIVVTGASGQLGAYLVDRLESSGMPVQAWAGRSPGKPPSLPDSTWRVVNLAHIGDIQHALDVDNPDIIFHLAAVSTAAAAHSDPVHAHSVNVAATSVIAEWCAQHRRRLVFTSTDMVFDGSRSFSREEDAPNPILLYGRTKADAERAVLEKPGGLVARLSLLYGFSRSTRLGFFDRAVLAMRRGIPQTFFEDEFRTPLDYGSAVAMLVRLALSDVTGLIHIAGRERLSRWELMKRAADALGIDPALVSHNSIDEVRLPEPRPRDVSLDTSRLMELYPHIVDSTIENALRNSHANIEPRAGAISPFP